MKPILYFSTCLHLLLACKLDVEDPASFNHSSIAVNGHNYHFVDEGPRDAQLIVMCHGFPELWYMYKHQIKHLSELGYRVVALDMIGYGQSDAPKEISAYTYESVSKDMKDLVPKLGAKSAVFLGHDWGSPIAWMMAVSHPEVVDGVISIGVPFYGPLSYDLETIIQFIPALSYQLSIANSNIAKMDKDKRRFLDSFLSADPKALRLMSTAPKDRQILDFIAEQEFDRKSVLSQKDMEYMVSEYSRHGTEGPTNWYRNFDANQRFLKQELTRNITKPAFFIKASDDIVNEFGNDNAKFVTNLDEEEINSGHWVHYIKPNEVNKALSVWLLKMFPVNIPEIYCAKYDSQKKSSFQKATKKFNKSGAKSKFDHPIHFFYPENFK